MSVRRPGAFRALLATLCLACGAGEAPDAGSQAASPLVVYAVNHPLAFFAERIGGDAVRVVFPAPPDVDPAFWSPPPETVAEFQQADLVLLNGAGYAKWVERATLPRRRVVDASAAIGDRLLPSGSGVVHSHGPKGDHSHRGTAFTVWLDPELAIEQARAIAAAFERARPQRGEAFRAGLADLESDLRALDAELARAARSLAGAPILFSHPVYPYLEARYGLNARSLHWEPDAPPTVADWRALEVLRESHPARILVWEAEPLPETRARLEARGVRSVVFAPAANRGEDGDWLAVMRANAERLARAGLGSS